MTNKINDGGAAFPLHPNLHSKWTASTGMTLRDWFAGQAIPALVEAYTTGRIIPAKGPYEGVNIAREAFRLADAMLEAREVSND